MRVIIVLIFSAFSFSVNALNISAYSRTEIASDSIYAIYNYISQYGTEAILLKLYKNKTYVFLVNSHFNRQQHFSKGSWERKGNYFILNSAIRQKEIPITIIQSNSGSESEYINIEDITNDAGAFLRTVEMMTNNDTSKFCYPNLDNNCKIKKRDLKSIQLKFENNTTSAWHTINTTEDFNSIKIVENIDFNPDFYIFFSDKKFMIQGQKLYDSERNTYFHKGPFKKLKSRKEKNYY
jgi:hypothetical protein